MRVSRLSVLCVGLWLALLLSVGLAPAATAAYPPDPIGPSGWVPDGRVFAVATSGSRVFVGGAFPGGVVALDASTGALLWTGNADGAVHALAVSSDGRQLVAGGAFNNVDGAAHRKLALLAVADGTAEPGWRASASGKVRAILVRGDVAYIGGQFGKHNGLDQRGLGAVSVGTGEGLTAFDAATDAKVHALATDGTRLFVGGKFTQVNGQSRDSLAAVELATGSLDRWNPTRPCTGCNLYWDVLVDGDTVYVATRNAGAVTAFDASSGVRRWRVTANGDAQALAMADGLLYAGGHFAEIGNVRQPRSILAALDPATGAIDPDFTPKFFTPWPGIWALEATSSRLHVGGAFSAAGAGKPRRFPYFAMFGSASGNTVPTARAAADPTSAETGEQITFTAADSSDAETPDGLDYAWDFGDGGTANGVQASHSYQQAGEFTAKVTVTDPDGASDTDRVDMVIRKRPRDTTAPTARVRFDPRPAFTGADITFHGAGSSDDTTHPDDLTYGWSFDDGTRVGDDTGQRVTVRFGTPGIHQVQLTVTDEAGNAATATRKVRVGRLVHCQAPKVDREDGWQVRADDRAVRGSYCHSDGRPRGDSVSFSFRGPWVSVVHGDARRGGQARVFIDGERQRSLLFRGQSRRIEFLQQKHYRALGPGEHTIRIVMARESGFVEGIIHRD